ncbi:putative reverse transcriptase domain, reverse transcriptase zinc-binding domain protein, partial [Tanacetum coccineum]
MTRWIGIFCVLSFMVLVFMISWFLGSWNVLLLHRIPFVRQGDPLSPYLFTLVMEVLTLMIQRKVHETDRFTYHMYCSKMELVNLCFADDLFLFAYGDVDSASIIKEALDEFKKASG